MKTLGIDFGTTHTYFVLCPSDGIMPEAISLAPSQGLDTAVLYDRDNILIGNEALEEYSISPYKGRKGYDIRLQFKPEICISEDAARNSVDFFSKVLKKRPDLLLDVGKILIGVPGEAPPGFSKKLKDILKEAGYGPDAETLEEPVGALIYYISNGDIHPEDALGETIIVDFGGGTCDFAYMVNGRPVSVWGDMEYGGRIFDDLFFQWFIDQNPKALEKMVALGQQYFVLFHECRKAKEHFSEIMKQRNREGKGTSRIVDYGFITDMTWKEFEHRATNYYPSEIFVRWMEETGSCKILYEKIRSGGMEPIDLFRRFQGLLVQGMEDNRLTGKVKQVILAGGSSLWLWVREIVSNELMVPPEKIKQSANPYAVIASGLSVLPALRLKNKRTKERLQRDFPGLLKKRIRPILDRRFQDVSSEISVLASMELYREIHPILKRFRKKGGKISTLKREIAEKVSLYEPTVKGHLAKKISFMSKAITGEIMEALSQWFTEYDLVPPKLRMDLLGIGGISTEINVETSMGDIIYTIIFSVVSGMLCGGSGVALIASGPLGLIVGAMAGAAIWLGSKSFLGRDLRNLPEKILEDIDIPARILGVPVSRLVLPMDKIERFQKDLEDSMKEQLYRQLKDQLPRIEEQIKMGASSLIDAISEIDMLLPEGLKENSL